MSIRNTPAGLEYVIVETKGSPAVYELCSYNNPQDAIDFLTRSFVPIDPEETVYVISTILKRYRSSEINIENAVVSIMEVVFKIENNTSPSVEVLRIFFSSPYAMNPLKFIPLSLENNKNEYTRIASNHSYMIYTFIYRYLTDRDVKDRLLDNNEEAEWIKTCAKDLYARLFRKYIPR